METTNKEQVLEELVWVTTRACEVHVRRSVPCTYQWHVMQEIINKLNEIQAKVAAL